MESLDGSHCEEHSTELEQNPETDGTVIGRNTRRYYGAGRYSATERTAKSIGTGAAASIPPGTVAFYRKYYYLQSTAQIARELGMTERAVEGKLYRLKKKLRNLLGGDTV